MAKAWGFHTLVIALLLWGFGTDPAFGPRVAVLTVLFYLVGILAGVVTTRYKELNN